MPVLMDMTGWRFGRLEVLRRDGSAGDGKAAWLCRCDCGQEKTFSGGNLRNGISTSCGCLRSEMVAEKNRKYAGSGTKSPLYSIWLDMKRRCYDDKHESYANYGARGITVCDRWVRGDDDLRGFDCFVMDMGSRPSKGHSIDRLNNDGPYSPENCHWATSLEQGQNKRNNLNYLFRGEVLCLKEISRRSGVKYNTLVSRKNRGWPASRIVEGISETA